MKIQQSIRLYVFAVMLLTGGLTIFVLSAFSLNYFIKGMDVAIEHSIISEARQAVVTDGKPLVTSFVDRDDTPRNIVVISSRWEDQPIAIRERFNVHELQINHLEKVFSDSGPYLITPPKAGFFAVKVQSKTGIRYASMAFVAPKKFKVGPVPHVVMVGATALAAILVFSGVLFAVMRSVSGPVWRLKDWAKSLGGETLNVVHPDFRYRELNTLAGIIQTSLISVKESADREKRFLGFASHELRTPIAVTRTNTELLRKLIENGADAKKTLAVVDRIERASLTMSGLTEALLWLNRQDEKAIPEADVSLGELVCKVTADLEYLLKNKDVEVELETDDGCFVLPEILCRIVISNLIRNAFQHTNEGRVKIRQTGLEIEIVNQNNEPATEDSELGFGLGLELTESLIQKYKWHYTNAEVCSGREVHINFTASD